MSGGGGAGLLVTGTGVGVTTAVLLTTSGVGVGVGAVEATGVAVGVTTGVAVGATGLTVLAWTGPGVGPRCGAAARCGAACGCARPGVGRACGRCAEWLCGLVEARRCAVGCSPFLALWVVGVSVVCAVWLPPDSAPAHAQLVRTPPPLVQQPVAPLGTGAGMAQEGRRTLRNAPAVP